ncbi:hypothetical protein D3C71_820110 [compost metagenome]
MKYIRSNNYNDIMKRDWEDFKCIYGIAGARIAFEKVCGNLFQVMHHPVKRVGQIKGNPGDWGIDVFIGELGIEQATVIQCKFFLEKIGRIQQDQINASFERAITCSHYQMKNWILCIPKELTGDEHLWFSEWKDSKIKKLGLDPNFISILDGNNLINLLKQHNLYNIVFQMEDSLKIAEIHTAVITNPTIQINSDTKKVDRVDDVIKLSRQRFKYPLRPKQYQAILDYQEKYELQDWEISSALTTDVIKFTDKDSSIKINLGLPRKGNLIASLIGIAGTILWINYSKYSLLPSLVEFIDPLIVYGIFAIACAGILTYMILNALSYYLKGFQIRYIIKQSISSC